MYIYTYKPNKIWHIQSVNSFLSKEVTDPLIYLLPANSPFFPNKLKVLGDHETILHCQELPPLKHECYQLEILT